MRHLITSIHTVGLQRKMDYYGRLNLVDDIKKRIQRQMDYATWKPSKTAEDAEERKRLERKRREANGEYPGWDEDYVWDGSTNYWW